VAPIDVAPALSGAELDAVDWVHRSRTFEALGHRFAVRSTASGIGRYIDRMYAGCVTDEPGPVTWYSLLHELATRPHALYVGVDRLVQSVRPCSGAQPPDVARQPAGHRAAWRSRFCSTPLRYPSMGAGCCSPPRWRPGRPRWSLASSVRASTTSPTRLPPSTRPRLRMHPYAKPLSIDPGSWSVLPELRPASTPPPPRTSRTSGRCRRTRSVRSSFASPGRRRHGGLPRYEADVPHHGAFGSAGPLALVAALEQTFHFHEHGANDLATLARVVDGLAATAS
jgi:hypothetical protein